MLGGEAENTVQIFVDDQLTTTTVLKVELYLHSSPCYI